MLIPFDPLPAWDLQLPANAATVPTPDDSALAAVTVTFMPPHAAYLVD